MLLLYIVLFVVLAVKFKLIIIMIGFIMIGGKILFNQLELIFLMINEMIRYIKLVVIVFWVMVG